MSCGCGNTSLPTGPAGVNGFNAFTVTTASFVMPAIGASVNISVSATNQYTGIWAALGQVIYISDGTNDGYFEVTTVGTQTTIGVKNLGYTGNAAPGAVFAIGSKVSPGGLQGPAGVNGNDGTSILAIEYNALPINQTGSYAQFLTTSLNPATLTANGDSIHIQGRMFYQQNSTGANNGRFKIQLFDGANTVDVAVVPTTFFGGNTFVGLSKTFDVLDFDIIVTKASATTCNFVYKYKVGTALDYSLEEYVLSASQNDIGGEKRGISTVTWANTVNINILGEVDNGSDEIKLGFVEIDLKKLI